MWKKAGPLLSTLCLQVDREQVEVAEFRPQSWERVPGGCGSCRTVLGRRGSRRWKRCGFNPWVRKLPWRRHGNPLQYSCLENRTDRGAWRATVHRVTKSWTQLKQLSMYVGTQTIFKSLSSLRKKKDKIRIFNFVPLFSYCLLFLPTFLKRDLLLLILLPYFHLLKYYCTVASASIFC